MTLKSRAWSRLVAIGREFFCSPKRWQATGALVAIAALLLALNGLNVANSYVGRNFITAIARRDHAQYLRFAVLYLCVFAASALTGVSQQFVQDRLTLSWRNWLTGRLIASYLSGHTFERINASKAIDNPDQRITEDVSTFTSALLSFAVMIANAAITTIAFAGVLWSIAPLLLLGAVLYACFGTALTILLGFRLVALNNRQRKVEADLRYGLIHLREHGEPLGERGKAREGRRIRARLRRVIHNSRVIIGVSRNMGFFTSGYNYLVPILPIFIVAPLYLRGKIELGVVTQSAMAFAQLLGAFSLIVAQFQAISTFTVALRRLGTLWEEMEASDRDGPQAVSGTMIPDAPT
jgi:vitamin B12/bleomycin/antimicrobial peptide transport system ATP-binding/permease protein